MKKKSSAFLLIFCQIFLTSVSPQEAFATITIPITAPSAILIDNASSKIIFSKTPHQRRPPASTTKLLTAIVAADQMDLDQVVTIPAYVEKMEPSKIYLRRGEKYRVKDLIRAILLSSANDAAEALAFNGGSGSRWRFTELMNQKAQALGCQGSNFVNPTGLPDSRQYSTAYDMALIMRETQRYPFLAETMKIRTMYITNTAGRRIGLKNHNKMLWRQPSAVVGKTGWTRSARHCFVGMINAQGRKIFVSMLGSHKLWRDLMTLMSYQFGSAIIKVQKNKRVWSINERKKIQLALKRAGYKPGSVDGHFGPATVRAIQRFQKAHGIKPNGIVGPLTWKKLQAHI